MAGNIAGKFADQDSYVVTGQVQTSNNNQITLNATLAETDTMRGSSVIFQPTGLVAVTSNPVPNVTSTLTGTIGAALSGQGQAGSASTEPGGGGIPCFTADTPVWMADNTHKSIGSITLGEWVKAFDSHGNIIDARVTGLHQHITFETLKVTLEDKKVVHTTPLHKFWVKGDVFKPVFTLAEVWIWDDVWTSKKIVGKEMLEGEMIVYNLTIDVMHTYIANGIAVSNLKPLPSETPEQF